MADDSTNKNPQEKYMSGEKPEDSFGPERPEVRPESEPARERPETRLERDLAVEREKLEREAEKFTPREHEEAEKESVSIREMSPEGKIDRLIRIAEEKGPVFAVGTAKKLGDAWALDKLHDFLEKDENYKKM